MKKLFILILSVFFVTPGSAAEYTVRQKEGSFAACYHNDKRVSGAKFCHNCRNSGGNKIVWQFQVFCEGRPTQKLVKASIPCKKSIPKEGDQAKTLYEEAEEIMDDHLQLFYSWRDCDLGGWKE